MSDVARLTFGGGVPYRKGDRLDVGSRPAVVKRVESAATVTIAYRDAWYWRVAWRLQDDWRADVAAIRRWLAALRPPETP
jgi:hypothetical protein